MPQTKGTVPDKPSWYGPARPALVLELLWAPCCTKRALRNRREPSHRTAPGTECWARSLLQTHYSETELNKFMV